MELSALQQAIANALDPGKRFELTGSTLSQPVADLFTSVFGAPTLELSGASAETTSSTPSAQGTLSSPPAADYPFLAGLPVTAAFRLDGSHTPQVTLAFTSHATSWGLSSVVPAVGGGVLGMFSWSAGEVDFDSQAPIALPATFPACYGLPTNTQALLSQLRTGMSFRGQATFTGADPGLALVLGTQPFHASGPVEWWGAVPRMDIASAPLTTLTFAGFELPIEFHFAATIPPVAEPGCPAKPFAIPAAVLHGTLERPTTGTALQIPFYVIAAGTPVQFVSVVGDFQESSSLGLADLAKLLGVASLDSQQSSGFPALSGLALDTVELVVDWPAQRLLTASATVGFTPPGGPWKPFGSIFQFDGMQVTFTAIGPLESPTLETVVAAEVTLAGGKLQGELALPELTFTCELESGNPPIDLTEVLQALVGTAFGSFQLMCPELKVLGDHGAGTYRLIATVQESPSWGFSLGQASFELGSIGFDLTRSTQGAGTTAGQVVAVIEVAGVAVQISADYDPAQTGWAFSGGTLGQPSISLTGLVSDALSMFGLACVSAKVPDVTITDLQMMLQTGNWDFGFSCAGTVEIAGSSVGIEIDLGRTHDSGDTMPPTTTFMGYITVGASTFEADFTAAPGAAGLKFSWTGTDQPLGFHDIAAFFDLSVPSLPGDMDLALTQAELYYDFGSGTLAVSATSRDYGQVTFVSYPRPAAQGGARVAFLCVDVPLVVELSQLPVAGGLLPASADLGIADMQLLYASDQLQSSDQSAIGQVLGALGSQAGTPTTIPGGFTSAFTFSGGGTNYPIALALGPGSGQQPHQAAPTGGEDATDPSGPPAAPGATTTPAAPQPAAAPVSPGGTGSGVWLKVERTFGPLNIRQIGARFADGMIWVVLNAGLVLPAVELDLLGLGVGFSLALPPSVSPRLDGLAVSAPGAPVDISGGLMRQVVGGQTEFDGQINITAAEWQLSALGSYTTIGGAASLFAFAVLDAPLGGPPFFFVTGVAAGLGVNRDLVVPPVQSLGSFPLVQAVMGASPLGAATTVGTAITAMGTSIPPLAGENWIAAGVRFTSCQLLESFVLLTVRFGQAEEMDLLGTSVLMVPPEADDPIAYAELDLIGSFRPAEGAVRVIGELTPASYILAPGFQLTGGFAFCSWQKDQSADGASAGAKAGDFVVTLGGYHPAFTPPAWYPAVPRLGASWQSGGLTLKGQYYFALTPSAVMGGGAIEASWSGGPVSAWFDANADFLLCWQPFQYQASVSIDIGVSVEVDLLFTSFTVTASLGVSIDFYGPPFGGVAYVDFYVCSFAISFGAGRPDRGWITWPQFRGSFLPAGDDGVCGTKITGGLVKDLSGQAAAPGSSGPYDWIVNPGQFELTSYSAIPVTALTLTGTATAGASGTSSFGVGPVGLADGGLISTHAITIAYHGDAAKKGAGTAVPVQPTPVIRNVPAAAWSLRAAQAAGQADVSTLQGVPALVEDVVSGYALRPAVPASHFTGPVDLDLLLSSDAPGVRTFPWSGQVPAAQRFSQTDAETQLEQALSATAPAAAARSAIVTLLQAEQVVPAGTGIDVHQFAADAPQVLMGGPVLSSLGAPA